MNVIKRAVAFITIVALFVPLLLINNVSAHKVKEYRNLSADILSEGIVMLKNNDVLPVSKKQTLAIFGSSQVDYYVGGGGSSVLFTDYTVSPVESIRKAAENGKFGLYEPLAKTYEEYVTKRNEENTQYGENAFIEETDPKFIDYMEMPLSDEIVEDAKNNADVAVIFISRYATEGIDMAVGTYYLSKSEKEMISKVTAAFDKVVAILNVPCVMDSSWFAGENPEFDIDAVLMAWYYGEETMPICDILCGDTSPSGKLTVTMAADYTDYLSADNFYQKRDVYYEEDIFVGYRQFETFDPEYSTVNYEFGFGLSYTTFDINCKKAAVSEDGKNIELEVSVKNTGKVPGKEVVQVYFSAPQGKLGKPGKELATFAKTDLLKPGKSQTLKMSFPINDMSSYDDTGKVAASAYVLEAGDYKIYVGNSIKDAGTRHVMNYTIAEDIITEQLSQRGVSTKLTKRLLADGSYEELILREVADVEFIPGRENGATIPDNLVTLVDVYRDPELMDSFLSQLTIEEMATIAGGQGSQIGFAAGGVFGDVLEKYVVPHVDVTDGSVGVRVDTSATYFPSSLCLASTWNLELANKFGKAVGDEARKSGIEIWLGPGMNLIRNPMCGRNFEYYSEDPLVTGKMAAAVVSGVQSYDVGVTLKHYAANNKETARGPSDSQVSERALREIYLKGFEICVKEADPWGIMTTCGTVNGSGLAGNYDLMYHIPRLEWGFSGLFMSDWANMDNETAELLAGHNLCMPSSQKAVLISAYNAGVVTRSQLEWNTYILLSNAMKFHSFQKIVDKEYAVKIDKFGKTSINFTEYNWAFGIDRYTLATSNEGEKYFTDMFEDSYMIFNIDIEKEGIYKFEALQSSSKRHGSYCVYVDGNPVYRYIAENDTREDKTKLQNNELFEIFLEEGAHEVKYVVEQLGMTMQEFTISRDLSSMIVMLAVAGGALLLVAAGVLTVVIIRKKRHREVKVVDKKLT